MIKKVMKNNKTSGKVNLPIDWVGKEVDVTLVEEKKLIGDKSLEELVDMIVEKAVYKLKFHEKVPEKQSEPENKIFQNPPTFPIATPSSKLNLDDLACRTNQETCGRTGEAINDDLCNACENPICKYFYEKKNWCNKDNKTVKCKGNLRACSIKQDVGKDI